MIDSQEHKTIHPGTVGSIIADVIIDTMEHSRKLGIPTKFDEKLRQEMRQEIINRVIASLKSQEIVRRDKQSNT